MNYFTLFIVSFTIALSGALMPGPLLATVIYESAKQGSKAGPLMILGHAFLEVLMLAFLIFGFTYYIRNPLALKIIALSGTFILCFFGLKMLLSIPKLTLDFGTDHKPASNLVLAGITMSLANPYWTIWWLTIGLGLFLGAQKVGYIAVGVFFAGHILADLAWYSVVSFTISKGRQFIPRKVYQGIILVCALVLIAFGLYFGLNYSRMLN